MKIVASYLLILITFVLPSLTGLGGLIGIEDPIDSWLNHPDKRNSAVHIALVEIVSISNESHSYRKSTNSKVSDDGGKTWYNLLSVWSGTATLRVVESPNAPMPATITVNFERCTYVPMRGKPPVDWLVKPGARLLGFFSKKDGRWSLQIYGFLDPVDYLLNPRCANRLQSLFKNPLSDEKTLATREKIYYEAGLRAKNQAETNHVDLK